uniref:Uncharacterized protein n=1 Tax=Timema poppense TaxID=170557 RepID=A0A7R9H2T5_TIMPO|nr:unnamed protein product [Timema poppensis]
MEYEQGDLSWTQCHSICTDSSPAMLGARQGFCARVKENLASKRVSEDLDIVTKEVQKLNLEFDRYIPEAMAEYSWVRRPFVIDVEDSPEQCSDIAGVQEELIEVQMELVAIMRSLTNWRKEFKPPFQQLMCLERKDEENSSTKQGGKKRKCSGEHHMIGWGPVWCARSLHGAATARKRAIVARASWRSFEVEVNGQVIHSKLSTMAFPDFTNVIDIVGDAAQGKEVKSVSVQQPITDCDIM